MDEAKSYRIYVVTNVLNGKKYVGQTSQTIEERWREHVANAKCGSRMYFHKAIMKYTADAFSIKLLVDGLLQENVDGVETHHIAALNTTDPNRGYNVDLGGQHGRHRTRRIRELMSIGKNKVPAQTSRALHVMIISMFNDMLSTREIGVAINRRYKQVEKVVEGHRKRNCISCFNDDGSIIDVNSFIEITRTKRVKPTSMGKAISDGKRGKPISRDHRISVSLTQRGQTLHEAREHDATIMELHAQCHTVAHISRAINTTYSIVQSVIRNHANGSCVLCFDP